MKEPGLTQISTEDLRRLLESIERGRIDCPLSPYKLTAHNLGHIAPQAAILMELGKPCVIAVLQAVLAERSNDNAPKLSLVWTGPDTKVSESRYTAIVVAELFSKARQSVLIGGYAFDHGQRLFEPLHRVMREHGVVTEIFVDIHQMNISLRSWARATRRNLRERFKLIRQAAQRGPNDYAHEIISLFLDAQWTFGDPKPAIYYDPRTAETKTYASLHAKCLVVDNRYTLITSANFTDRGQTRNIESGVLIEGQFALTVTAQWRRSIDSGTVVRY